MVTEDSLRLHSSSVSNQDLCLLLISSPPQLNYADLVIMSNLNAAPPMPEEPAYTVVKME